MRTTIIALTVVGFCVSPAFAQSKTPAGQQTSIADCTGNFKAADRNADGRLNKAEIKGSTKVVPTSLATKRPLHSRSS
jgi:hypothetical protein